MSVAITLALNALAATLVLSLAALGLAIIFGLLRVINLAHGAFIAIGAYAAWYATELGSFWAALVLAPLLVGAFGYAIEAVVVRRLQRRPLDTILATWGIALATREVLKLAFGVTTKDVPLPLPGRVDLVVAVYPTYRLFLIVASAAVLLTVFAILALTDTGVRVRAVIQDAEAASLLGVDEERTYGLAFAVGAALAGLAGAAIAPIATVAPDMGVRFLVESFFAVILGGTPAGVVLGAALVAGVSNLLTFSVSAVLARTLVFALAIVVVAARPRGLLGR